jgi:aspartate kinase
VSIIVQKYGGSSVATPNKIKEVAQRVVATQQKGHQVVVVVSAMGNSTNQLLSLAQEVSPQPQRRELDMLVTVGERISMSLLSMAIQDLGSPAVSFTGSQSGIITTNTHSNARIIAVKPYRLQRALNSNKIVIVAGFQGVSQHLEITSLGRGGSDTTAVALAAALGAKYAEICSDVDGVYSTDPRICHNAKKLDVLDYETMQVLADSGAKVLNAEAVEWAKRSGIEIHCVATQDPLAQGTKIKHSQHSYHHDSALVKESQEVAQYVHPQILAITHHPGLYYVTGNLPIFNDFMSLLIDWGMIDIELNHTTEGWHAWIPVQNIHQPQAFQAALQKKFNCQFDILYTHVTVLGRGLLSHSRGQKNIYQMTQEIINRTSCTIITQEIRQSHLRWTLPLSEGKSLVQQLHQTLL